jgi:putative ABC transport system permease protein
VHSVDPEIALAELRTMDEVKRLMMSGDRFTMLLYGSFALVALSLAAIGIYGVMAFTVAQREHEIGLRMALGASRSNVVGLILREGVALALVGLGLGLIGAYFVGKAMSSTLYGVGALDFSAVGMVAGVLFGSAVLASWVPARRAASVEPMQALRSE